MHIDSHNGVVYVPLYGNDIIAKISKSAVLALSVADSLDAPAGVSVYGREVAIADFYNHRVLYTADGVTYEAIGSEGKGDGEFYYPTDVQLTADEIWVADAYNNRVQVFDKKGNFLRIIGADQGFNAATGIFVSEDELFVTDFENDRVLVFDHTGTWRQTISQGIEKPTDVIHHDDTLFIANYRSGELSLFKRGK
jgi:DNA-binding beta-propeller fold protein YncE